MSPSSPAAPARHSLVVVMGVSGSGKSTVGPPLAETLGVPFVDGDNLHSPAAKARMAAGHPLDDAARAPWLDRLHEVLVAHADRGVVLACSALKDSYRRRLAGDLPGVVFLALVAPPTVLEDRLESRAGHFVGPELLPSQLETLELGDDVVRIDNTRPVAAVTADTARAVRQDPR